MSKHDYQSLRSKMKPESLAMSYGYNPAFSEGAVKCPIYQTSTFVFRTAEEGKEFFEVALGKRQPDPDREAGLIYSRINNPDIEILEDRLTLWDEADDAAVFESGMAAISTAVLAFVSPGDLILHSDPLYGGTDYLFKSILARFGVQSLGVLPGESREAIRQKILLSGRQDRLAAVFVETPANPTNHLIDIQMLVSLAAEFRTPERSVPVLVDNTFLGPLFQRPLVLGADLVIYSATKYLGGHSDVIAGACLGRGALIQEIKKMRTYLGTGAGPWTGWLLMRSLETLSLRMSRQAETAKIIAARLAQHPKVAKVYYPGLYQDGDPQIEIYRRQCLGPGAMISFDVMGGEAEAFRVLNRLKLIKLAVSLGGTESLAEHPKTMTHAGVDEELKRSLGISDQMIRLSVGVEDPDDLWMDLGDALGLLEGSEPSV
ncbi:MAG: cystathionine gamma-synthase family protein [Bdellovibrionaceae bacterium]|nr:cystathionine gamma-synthase family protein [Pseudobdellovibrionaceae bacterium]